MLDFKPSITMGKKGDLRGFECAIVVGLLPIQWDLPTQPSLGFAENGPKKCKYPVGVIPLDEKLGLTGNVLFLTEARYTLPKSR